MLAAANINGANNGVVWPQLAAREAEKWGHYSGTLMPSEHIISQPKGGQRVGGVTGSVTGAP